MSRYRQFCGVARALDLVGDRWALLVVRELLPGPRRFTDLRGGLPGIASNLLVRRLEELQDAGVVERRLAPKGHVYALTAFGEGLRDVLHALVRWSAPTMATGPAEDDTFEPQWLGIALEAFLDDARPGTATTVAFEAPGARVLVTADAGGARAEADTGAGGSGGARASGTPGVTERSGPADATVAGPGPLLLGVVSGAVPLEAALERGVTVSGDPAAVALVTAGRTPAE